jgi:putrescine aminotransferase
MPQNITQALEYSKQWIDRIHQTSLLETEARQIIEESKYNFSEHFNKGWLEYRKSVTEAGDWAAVEWTGSGAIFRDVLGREFIDCLGGYGLMDLGWSHPEVIDAVRAQLNRSPMPSQELIDPLRGVLARLMAQAFSSPAAPRRSKGRSNWRRCTPARTDLSWVSTLSMEKPWGR